jgi:hypothetical protein
MNEDKPELPRIDDTRKTRELCGSERDDGKRCMRPKGHQHQHASYGLDDTVVWE